MTVDINTVVSLHYKLTNHQTGEKIEETLGNGQQFMRGDETEQRETFEELRRGLDQDRPQGYKLFL